MYDKGLLDGSANSKNEAAFELGTRHIFIVRYLTTRPNPVKMTACHSQTSYSDVALRSFKTQK